MSVKRNWNCAKGLLVWYRANRVFVWTNKLEHLPEEEINLNVQHIIGLVHCSDSHFVHVLVVVIESKGL